MRKEKNSVTTRGADAPVKDETRTLELTKEGFIVQPIFLSSFLSSLPTATPPSILNSEF